MEGELGFVERGRDGEGFMVEEEEALLVMEGEEFLGGIILKFSTEGWSLT